MLASFTTHLWHQCHTDITIPSIGFEIREKIRKHCTWEPKISWAFWYYPLPDLGLPSELKAWMRGISVRCETRSSVVSKLSANAEQMSGLRVGGTVPAHSVVCVPLAHTVDFCQWCASVLLLLHIFLPLRSRTVSSFVPVDSLVFGRLPLRGWWVKAFMFKHAVWQCITSTLSLARLLMIHKHEEIYNYQG